MGRPSYLYPDETINKVQLHIKQQTGEDKYTIAALFNVEADFVYQAAYRMGMRLPRAKKKKNILSREEKAIRAEREKQRQLDFARDNSKLTVAELAKKLHVGSNKLRYLLVTNKITVRRMRENKKREVPVKAPTEFFEHDDLFWTGYREN